MNFIDSLHTAVNDTGLLMKIAVVVGVIILIQSF